MSGPNLRRILLVLVCLAPAGCLGFRGHTAEFDRQPLIADPSVRHGILDNGLTYFIRANAEPPGRAELRLVVDAGSILEDPDQRGLAHVVEHMAFNGTRNFAKQELIAYLESIGMRFGPDINAYTSFDETVYTLTVPTDSAEVLRTGVQILHDWATGIEFDSLQIELERAVIIEEWRLGQSAAARMQHRQFPTLMAESRYAERLPIGTYASLTSFTHEALRRFYDDWYRPDLMAVVAVGDFDPAEVEQLIRAQFDTIAARSSPRPRPEFGIPQHRETLVSIDTDPELTSTSVSLHLKRPPRPSVDLRDLRAWIIESLATGMLVNRLSEYAQLPDSPILDVSSYHGRFLRPLSTLAITTRVPDTRLEEGAGTMFLELERAARHGFTASELEREKTQLLRAMEQRFIERDRTTSTSFAGDFVSHFLYGGRILDPERLYRAYAELIPGIRLEETRRAVREWSDPANRVLLVGAPSMSASRLPPEADLLALLDGVRHQEIAAYEDVMSDADLISDLPLPGRIVGERVTEGAEITIWELENGATFVVKPTSFREDEVLFAARSPGGLSQIENEDYIAGLTAAAVVQSGGLGELSSLDLRKRLTGTVAGVGVDIGELHEGLSGAASPRDLELLFQLVHLKFVAPRPDTLAFLAYAGQARAAMANRIASPELAFQDTLRLTLSQNHPRGRPPSLEMFENLDMHRSFEIYRDRFADAGDFTFFLVGSFALDEVRPLVEQYIATLPSAGRVEHGVDHGVRPPSGVVRKVVRHGIEPRGATQIVFHGELEFERSQIIALQTLAEVLRLRLRESLREDLGGTYGVEVRSAVVPDPLSRFQLAIGFGSDPERVAELSDVVFSEIADLRTHGPSETDLAKIAEMQFRSRETDLRQNYFWITQMMLYTQYGWDIGQIPTTAARPTQLSVSSLRDAAERFLNPESYVQVSLLPEVGGTAPE